jgi:hypothetical protein
MIQSEPVVCDLISKAWADEEFKVRLLASPTEVLAEVGIDIPCGVDVAVLEDTSETVHFVLPLKPATVELYEQNLARVVWGPSESGHICAVCKAGE